MENGGTQNRGQSGQRVTLPPANRPALAGLRSLSVRVRPSLRSELIVTTPIASPPAPYQLPPVTNPARASVVSPTTKSPTRASSLTAPLPVAAKSVIRTVPASNNRPLPTTPKSQIVTAPTIARTAALTLPAIVPSSRRTSLQSPAQSPVRVARSTSVTVDNTFRPVVRNPVTLTPSINKLQPRQLPAINPHRSNLSRPVNLSRSQPTQARQTTVNTASNNPRTPSVTSTAPQPATREYRQLSLSGGKPAPVVNRTLPSIPNVAAPTHTTSPMSKSTAPVSKSVSSPDVGTPPKPMDARTTLPRRALLITDL